MDEAWLLSKEAEVAAITVEVQGMIALNQYRIGRGETIAYDEAAFQERANDLWAIANLFTQEIREAAMTKQVTQSDLADLRTEILRDVNRDIALKMTLHGINRGWEWEQ